MHALAGLRRAHHHQKQRNSKVEQHNKSHSESKTKASQKTGRGQAHRLDLAAALPASAATAPTPVVLPRVGIPAPAVLIPALLELGLMILEPNANCFCWARVALGGGSSACGGVSSEGIVSCTYGNRRYLTRWC